MTTEEPILLKTLRDEFAARAMQAFISNPNCDANFDENEVAQFSYIIADAMLKAREE